LKSEDGKAKATMHSQMLHEKSPTNRTINRVSIGWITTATSFGFVVVQLDVTIVNVALQRISTDLHASMAALQWVVDAYALWTASGGVSIAAGPVVGGLLLSAFGWRSIFLVNLPSNLSIFSFSQNHSDPAVGNSFSVTYQRISRENCWLRIQN
jgi:MFS family permease